MTAERLEDLNMEQEDFRELLRKKGLKATTQRLLVLELMAKRPGQHLTAEEIYGVAADRCPKIGLATIYRTLQVLADLGVICKVSFDDGFARYELGGLENGALHRHHHVICKRCGSVLSCESDLLAALEQAVLKCSGFLVTDHEVKLRGYCRECQKAMENYENENNKMEVKD